VADVVSALRAAAGRSGVYNIATGVETDVATIWRSLAATAGSDIEPELAELRPGELQHSCLDIGRAREELGWEPAVPIEEGLALTYRALVQELG
jgi:UDP-glucose 4-epimerase